MSGPNAVRRVLPPQPPAWVRKYVGIPFVDRGRDHKDGLDCWGLVRHVYQDRFHVPLPHLNYPTALDAKAASLCALQQQTDSDWVVTKHPHVGDVVLFRVGEHDAHVGVLVAQAQFLHSNQSCGMSTVERLDTGLWQTRLSGIFRWAAQPRLVGRPSPVSTELVDMALPEGMTVSEMLAAAKVPETPGLRAWCGPHEIPRDRWGHVRLKSGRVLTIAAAPSGEGKSPTRIVLSIAVLAAALAAPYALAGVGVAGLTVAGGGLTLGGSLLAAGVGLGGALAVNALVKPPRSRFSDDAGPSISASITGSRNRATPFGVIPVVAGTHRTAPLYGAQPYTEAVGDDQYLRMLFVVGYGPLEIEDLRIGETPIEEYEGVEVEIREGREGEAPITIYPGVVLEEPLSVQLTQAMSWITRTTGINADEISVDITFPSGLLRVASNGDRQTRTVGFEIEYRQTGSGGPWQRVNQLSPDHSRGLGFLFREPEVSYGGRGLMSSGAVIRWGLGFGPKPSYLPTDRSYSWEGWGSLYVPADGVYEFGIDCSDAGEIEINRTIVASWYGTHGTAGGANPNFAAHSGSIFLRRGFSQFRVRMEARSTAGAVAFGWRPPGGSWQVVPAQSMATSPITSNLNGLHYRWFDTSVYDNSLIAAANRPEVIRINKAWAVPKGQYDVRIRRTTADPVPSDNIIDQSFWTAMRTIRAEDPITKKGLAVVAMRIKATDQLNGVVDEFNVLSRSIVRDFVLFDQTWVEQASSSPAAAYLNVLIGPANRRPIPLSRIDLPALQAWSERCRIRGYEYNAVIDTPGTVFERLSEIAAIGQASFGMRDGRYSVVVDEPKTVPVQHLTPRNSSGYVGRRAFPDIPHALRIRFLDRDAGYQQNERLVFADGYDETNATEFETLELPGVTSGEEAHKHGRYHLAVGKLRPEVHELNTDIEHLVCTRGDLVLVTHDVTQWGLNSARIVGLQLDTAGNLRGLVLDERIVMDAGESYAVRVRLDDGTSWVRNVVTEVGEHTKIMLVEPVSANEHRPKRGDLVMFGVVGEETRELIVRTIAMDQDLSARLTLVDHAPQVHSAADGPIPPWDPGISRPPVWSDRPETPVIESIRSDDWVMVRAPDGSVRPRMLVTLRPQTGVRPLASSVQYRTRPVPPMPAVASGPFTHYPPTDLNAGQFYIEPVEQGETYLIRLRTLTTDGRASEWVEATHTVLGSVAPPPDAVSFDVRQMSDGTRRYIWNLGLVPPDVLGVVIRFGPASSAWNAMQPLFEGVWDSSPQELNDPPAGTWRFGLRAIDVAGNLSVNPIYVTRTLGEPRKPGSLVTTDAAALGWPGAKTNCRVAFPGPVLEPLDQLTWDTTPPTWNQWARWVQSPITTWFTYQHPPIDLGAVVRSMPAASASGDGTLSIEFSHSIDNVTYTQWLPLSAYEGQTVDARYHRCRVRAQTNATVIVPIVRRLVMDAFAPAVDQFLDDVSTSALPSTRRFGVGDVRLPIDPARFSVIRGVTLSFNMSGGGWSYEVIDKDPVAGPRVRLYQNGVPSDAVIDATIRGF